MYMKLSQMMTDIKTIIFFILEIFLHITAAYANETLTVNWANLHNCPEQKSELNQHPNVYLGCFLSTSLKDDMLEEENSQNSQN